MFRGKKILAAGAMVLCAVGFFTSFGYVRAEDQIIISVNNNSIQPDNKATIYWNTNLEANCDMDYGVNSDLSGGVRTNGSIIQRATATNDGKFHYVVNLNNLQPYTDYYYKVNCVIGDGPAASSQIYKLSIPKISVQDISNSKIFPDNSATINWTTDQEASCKAIFSQNADLNNSLSSSGQIFQTSATEVKNYYEAKLYNLVTDTKYYYKIQCNLSSANFSESGKFEIPAKVSAKPDLIIKDIYDEGALVKVKYCNEGGNAIDVNTFGIETFYIKVSVNGKTHTGTSGGSNYIFSVPKAGECAHTDGLPDGYFNLIAGSSYSATAVIDHLGEVNESNENNNTFTKTITIEVDSNSSDKIVVVSPNGGEVYKIEKDATYKSGNEITIKWQGGKGAVQIGLVKGSVTESNISSNAIAWINTKTDPNSSLIWNGKTVCDLDGTNCRDVYGQFKIVAVSKSTLGNFIVWDYDPNGDIANFDLSDNYFTTVAKDEDKDDILKEGRYRHAKWECADGTHFEKEDGSSCKTEATWKSIAKNSCKNSEIKEFEVEKVCGSETSDEQIQTIRARARDLIENKFEAMRAEIKELRDIIREQQTQIKYLVSLKRDVKQLSEKVESAINNFITYGVDENTKKLGEGERAAVIHSYKAAFNKLLETEDELSDAIKIANGRWPSMTSEEAEKEAKKQFEKIYKHIADMDNPHDNAAITVMAYGLRQKAENRNLNSETQGIKTFKNIYGHVPSSTEDWNIMQAITYSGASRGADTDGDLLLDEREAELGTDPNNPDTDGDGHKDGVEVANGFDPLK